MCVCWRVERVCGKFWLGGQDCESAVAWGCWAWGGGGGGGSSDGHWEVGDFNRRRREKTVSRHVVKVSMVGIWWGVICAGIVWVGDWDDAVRSRTRLCIEETRTDNVFDGGGAGRACDCRCRCPLAGVPGREPVELCRWN